MLPLKAVIKEMNIFNSWQMIKIWFLAVHVAVWTQVFWKKKSLKNKKIGRCKNSYMIDMQNDSRVHWYSHLYSLKILHLYVFLWNEKTQCYYNFNMHYLLIKKLKIIWFKFIPHNLPFFKSVSGIYIYFFYFFFRKVDITWYMYIFSYLFDLFVFTGSIWRQKWRNRYFFIQSKSAKK